MLFPDIGTGATCGVSLSWGLLMRSVLAKQSGVAIQPWRDADDPLFPLLWEAPLCGDRRWPPLTADRAAEYFFFWKVVFVCVFGCDSGGLVMFKKKFCSFNLCYFQFEKVQFVAWHWIFFTNRIITLFLIQKIKHKELQLLFTQHSRTHWQRVNLDGMTQEHCWTYCGLKSENSQPKNKEGKNRTVAPRGGNVYDIHAWTLLNQDWTGWGC